jgi:hypothetical protein
MLQRSCRVGELRVYVKDAAAVALLGDQKFPHLAASNQGTLVVPERVELAVRDRVEDRNVDRVERNVPLTHAASSSCSRASSALSLSIR